MNIPHRLSSSHTWLALCSLFIFSLSACQLGQPYSLPVPQATASAKVTPLLVASPTSQQATTMSETPTPVLIPNHVEIPLSPTPVVPTPTAMLDPLRFSFPQPVPAAISAWRPALYSIPWALSPYDHFYFSHPIAANEINWPVANYRYGGMFFENVVHSGVDIPAPLDTPVLAAGAGKVIWAGYGLFNNNANPDDPYGLAVAIRHDFGYNGQQLFTIYGHLNQVDVSLGQHVEDGEKLGLSGQTGIVTGPHLHFEVRLEANDYLLTRNPELWLVPPQGWGVLAGRVMNSGGGLLEGQLVTVRAINNGHTWKANTYHEGVANSDPYYQENVVVSDLPAGSYEIRIDYIGRYFTVGVQIFPGRVNYFTFRGRNGFQLELPTLPGTNFSPLFYP